MRIKREHCTGLVIDIQEKLYRVIAEKESLLTNCIKLLEGLSLLGIPTIFTQQYSKGLGSTISEIRSRYPAFTYVEKSTFSCLDEPVYADYLRRSGKVNVLIIGIESHVCVLQTAVDLKEKGYHPVVIADCIGSRQIAEKQIAMNRFIQEGICVSTMESILFELMRTSAAVEFKAISKLVK